MLFDQSERGAVSHRYLDAVDGRGQPPNTTPLTSRITMQNRDYEHEQFEHTTMMANMSEKPGGGVAGLGSGDISSRGYPTHRRSSRHDRSGVNHLAN